MRKDERPARRSRIRSRAKGPKGPKGPGIKSWTRALSAHTRAAKFSGEAGCCGGVPPPSTRKQLHEERACNGGAQKERGVRAYTPGVEARRWRGPALISVPMVDPRSVIRKKLSILSRDVTPSESRFSGIVKDTVSMAGAANPRNFTIEKKSSKVTSLKVNKLSFAQSGRFSSGRAKDPDHRWIIRGAAGRGELVMSGYQSEGTAEGALKTTEKRYCLTGWNKIVNKIGCPPQPTPPLADCSDHASSHGPPRHNSKHRLLMVWVAPQTHGHQEGEEPEGRMGTIPHVAQIPHTGGGRWVPSSLSLSLSLSV